MGKSAGKPGEMRYTGMVTDKAGNTTGESYRDGQSREWTQKQGAGTPKMVSTGQADRKSYNWDSSANPKKAR